MIAPLAVMPSDDDLISVTTVGDLVLSSAARHGDRPAITVDRHTLTHAEVAVGAVQAARSLAGLGVRRGDHVALLMANSLEFVTSMFGAALLGAVVVPINTRYRRAELGHVLRQADVHTVVTLAHVGDHVDLAERLVDAVPEIASGNGRALSIESVPRLRNVVALGGRQVEGMLSAEAFDALTEEVTVDWVLEQRRAVSVRDTALIPFTSGTTSNPKGCVLSHEAVVRNWMSAGRRLRATADDVFWDPCPVFHAAGWGPVIFTMHFGCHWVSTAHFEPTAGLEAIQRERATFVYSCYPAIAMALFGHPDYSAFDLSSVRGMLNVAPTGTLEVMQARLPNSIQVSGYGMTEGTGIMSFNEIDEPLDCRLRTVGRPFPGLEFRIVDPESGAPLDPDQPGEIQYRGFAIFDGYYNDAAATSTTITADGWVRSGDRGTLDHDGRLRFDGRLKEMLKVGGENVSPAEIESLLSTHPAVKLAQVVGLEDAKYGEVVTVFIERYESASISADEVVAFCADSLASFKVPRLVRFVNEWPMSATKIQKNRLVEQLREELPAIEEQRAAVSGPA